MPSKKLFYEFVEKKQKISESPLKLNFISAFDVVCNLLTWIILEEEKINDFIIFEEFETSTYPKSLS